jgi:hypothetical protein
VIEFELEQINFDLDRLMEAIPLDDERMRLKAMITSVPDFTQHHFSTTIEGRHGKNLLAHSRYTVRGDTFFVEEVQSDWAQLGRRGNWAGIPKGPYVTSTELWAGLVMRRLMQMAARYETVKQIAWITGDMRNGGRAGGNDGLNDFYAKIIPKLCEKVTGKLGRVTPREIDLGGTPKTVLGIDFSNELKEKLAGAMPLYSHGFLLAAPDEDHRRLAARAALLTERFGRLVGSAGALHLCSGLIDEALAAGTESSEDRQATQPQTPLDRIEGATGTYGRGLVQVCLQAEDPLSALDHESFHLAWDRLLYQRERKSLSEAFDPHYPLAADVQRLVTLHYGAAAGLSCKDSVEETCAYAFQLWASGRLQLGSEAEARFAPARSFFGRVREAILGVWKFVRGERDAGRDTPAAIFESLEQGLIAQERAGEDAAHNEPAPTF